jgi:hypothetical protein
MSGKPHETGTRTVIHSDRVCRADFGHEIPLFACPRDADENQVIPDTRVTGAAEGGRAFFGGILRSPGFVVLNLSAYAYQEVVSLVLAKILDQLRHHQKGLRPDFQGGPSGWQSS